MEIFRRTSFCWVFMLVLLIIIVKPLFVLADNSTLSESELVILGQKYSVNQEYEKVVDVYEKLLTIYPDTRNEAVYRELADVYETRLLLFKNAFDIYERYLKYFPNGRLRKQFETKRDFLKKQEVNWDLLKQYRFIQKTYYDREPAKNLQMMEELLKDNPDTFLSPDIYSWLSWEYHTLGNLKEARYAVEKYIDTFPENGKSVTEEISAYENYVVILTRLHRFAKAFDVLAMVYEKEPERFTNYGKKVSTVKKERLLWYGVVIAYLYIILVTIISLLLKPWLEKNFNLKLKHLLKGSILIIILTIIPMLIVDHIGYGVFYTFPTLALAGIISMFLINLLSPLSYRYNKRIYIVISILLIVAVVFVSFYKWDNLSVFYMPLGS